MTRLSDEQKRKRQVKLQEEARTLGIMGKYGVTGALGGVPDLLGFVSNTPTYLANFLGGDYQAPYEYITPKIVQGIDSLTDGALVPQNFTQKALGTGAEFIGSGAASAVPKAASRLTQFIAPKNAGDYAGLLGAGIGTEAAREIAPDSILTQILGGFAGGTLLNPPTLRSSAKALEKKFKQGFEPPNLIEAIKNKEAAARIGVHLTPAEASHNPFLAAKEARLGVDEKNAQKLYDSKVANHEQQNRAIEGLYDDITPHTQIDGLSPEDAIRETAKNIIAKQEKQLQERAGPHYAAVEKELIGEKIQHKDVTREYSLNELGEPILTTKTTTTDGIKFPKKIAKDPTIMKAIDDVWTDPKYKVEREGFEKNSVKILDLAKRRIDADIAGYKIQGNKDAVRVLQASKKRLTDIIDKAYPQYKLARSIYEEGSPAIEKIKDSAIGKVANRNDLDTKNIAKDLFDPTQTNHNTFIEVRDLLSKENPKAWLAITRQAMQRRVGSTIDGGSNFYNKIIKNKDVYRQFHDALELVPQAQQKLADMSRAFKNLLEPFGAKTAARLSKSSLDVPRSTGEFLKKMAAKFGGKKVDDALIDLITNPNWDKEFITMRQLPTSAEKAHRMSILLRSALERPAQNDKKSNGQENQETAPQSQSIPNYQEMSEEDIIKDVMRKGDFSKLTPDEQLELYNLYQSMSPTQP